MGIWPFRRRRKKNSSKASGRGIAAEKQPAIATNATPEFQVLRKSSISRYPPSRRSSYRRRHASSANHLSYAASSGIFVPDHAIPISSDEERAFTPQKQEHHSGAFASYFSEGKYSPAQSRESLQRSPPPPPLHDVDHHLPPAQEQPAPRRTPSAARVSGVIRKLSKRRKDSRPPPSVGVYNLGRHSSRSQRSAYGDRPYSQVSGVHASIHSIESQASGGAYRIKSFSVLTPRPKLVYEEGHGLWNQSREFQPTLVPSRSNSRRTTVGDVRRYKGPAVLEDNVVHRDDRIDDLVLELDDHELREAMERDSRRRQKKRQEAEERTQRRLERQSRKPPAVSGALETRDDGYGSLEHDIDMQDHEVAPSRQVVQSDEESDARPAEDTGNGTPLSWFNDNLSNDQINKQYLQYQPRDNITLNSMESRHGRHDEPEPIHETGEEEDSPTLPPEPMMVQPPLIAVSLSSDRDLEARTKTSGWTSFIRKATAARIRKGQELRYEGAGEYNISESDHDPSINATSNQRSGAFLEVENLRHRKGQTPGRHVPNEILNAMTALETGHFQEKNKEYEDEMRDTLSTPPNLAYQQDDGQASSRSSLERAPKQSPNAGNSRSVSQQSFNRPPSASRYSPSLGRYGSGSPDGFRPRSAMSTSLASIDSEGSWLSGKITTNPRGSLQQISPLRTSASSFRRQYPEFDDETNIPEDEFFTGVRPKSLKTNHGENDDEDDQGGARLDLEQSDESENEGSVRSETEQKMWREGVEKKVSVEENPPFLRVASSQGFLNEGSDETVKTIASIKADKPKDDDEMTIKDAAGDDGDQTTTEEFVTPSENPFNPLGSAFQTPAEEYRTPMGEPMKTLGGNGL